MEHVDMQESCKRSCLSSRTDGLPRGCWLPSWRLQKNTQKIPLSICSVAAPSEPIVYDLIRRAPPK